jgi:hypothetical protein
MFVLPHPPPPQMKRLMEQVTSQMSALSNTSMVAMRTCVLTLGQDSKNVYGNRSPKYIYTC